MDWNEKLDRVRRLAMKLREDSMSNSDLVNEDSYSARWHYLLEWIDALDTGPEPELSIPTEEEVRRLERLVRKYLLLEVLGTLTRDR